ncbi:MAG: hypothetical protein AMXMBFR56_34360 [Polyangiaceae bacterium]
MRFSVRFGVRFSVRFGVRFSVRFSVRFGVRFSVRFGVRFGARFGAARSPCPARPSLRGVPIRAPLAAANATRLFRSVETAGAGPGRHSHSPVSGGT